MMMTFVGIGMVTLGAGLLGTLFHYGGLAWRRATWRVFPGDVRPWFSEKVFYEAVGAHHRRHISVDFHSEADEHRPVAIIGDVHGCFDELKELLDRLPEKCHVVFVGDVVNKGPKSLDCLRLLQENGYLSTMGNHEMAVIMAWNARQRDKKCRPEYAWTDALSVDDIEFIQRMPFTISLPNLDTTVVHAGLLNGESLEDQSPTTMLMVRSVRQTCGVEALIRRLVGLSTLEASTLMDTEREGNVWWPLAYDPIADGGSRGHLVVYGHDARRQLQVRANTIGLDSGCLYGKKLSAVILPSREIIQVDAHEAYVEV